MNRGTIVLVAALLSAFAVPVNRASAQNPAVFSDGTPDKINPAAMHSFQIPSRGVLLNGFAYVAAGVGPHPTVILLHGFPDKVAGMRSDVRTILLIGHGMGDFVAPQAGSLDAKIRAVITISAADLGISRLKSVPADKHKPVAKGLAASLSAEGIAPLFGTTAEILFEQRSSTIAPGL